MSKSYVAPDPRFTIRLADGRRRRVPRREGLSLITGKLARWEPALSVQMARLAARRARAAVGKEA